jgi:hypothetical protein
MPDASIRELLARARRWRQFAGLFRDDEKTRSGLLATAARLEQRAAQMRRDQWRSAVAQREPNVETAAKAQ